jgi:adenine-specific DNA-methyltransferase
VVENGQRKKDSARLTWDSKPRRAPNPRDIEFQTAEVVIPNPAYGDKLPLSFRDGLLDDAEIDKKSMNRLVWGDNLLAMQALLSQGYEGKINLIYIDPPFDSKADYSHRMTLEGNEFTKEPSVVERLAYKDTWTGGTDSYLDMLYPRLQLMKRLLAEDGSIYVHLDWHVGHYVKLLLDEVFGYEKLLSEIIWQRSSSTGSSKAISKKFPSNHDAIFLYSKTPEYVYERQYKPYSEEYLRRFKHDDEDGRGPYRISDLNTYSEKTLETLKQENRLVYPKSPGANYSYKRYLYETQGIVIDDVWTDINFINPMAMQNVGYDTQKPSALLERIIKASSKEGGLVADFFCGSGTTLAVAGKLNRRWIGCELGKVGIQVTRARLVGQQSKPFLIENIGNYQREMIYLTGGRIWEMQQLILKLYGARPRDKMSGLGIRKTDDVEELVYVGYPDRPVTAGKVEELALQAQKLDGRGYERLIILGWDYEYNYIEGLEARKRALKGKLTIEIVNRDIPPDIYDYLKKAKTEEDIEVLSGKIQFYERPYLKMDVPQITQREDGKTEIALSIKRYALLDIPISQTSKKGQEDYTALMKIAKDNFAVLIDYWAVDWDYDGVTFKSQWQAFRGNGKRARTVVTETKEVLDNKPRTIAVRVVDIFGSDAGAVLEIKV